MGYKAVNRLLLCLLLVCGASVHIGRATAKDFSSPEYEIKATFLLNFGKFIEWPVAPPSSFFHICILGEDPFGGAMNLISGKSVRSLPIKVSHLESIKDFHTIENCNILFISHSEKGNFSEILEKINGQPIVTVADQKDMAKLGVMINLVTIDDKVRFEINLRSAKNTGVRISSEMLKLAIAILE
jgi:hypothetical protein